MRTIKFRAFIKHIGWVVPVEQINFDVRTVEVDLSSGQADTSEFDFDEVELMQDTGLKDINGVEIYEGDIVEAEDREWEVSFDDGCFIASGDGIWDELNNVSKPLIIKNIYEGMVKNNETI